MNILLLAPKHRRESGTVPDHRAALTGMLQARGHRPVVLEQEPDRPGETLREKFLRLAGECQQVVLIWPPGAAMATTADELVLLQEVYDNVPIDVVLILHEAEVELREHELHVHFAGDQSRYLDGILACRPFILPWAEGRSFESVLSAYADGFL